MRKIGFLIAGGVLILAAAALVENSQAQQKGGGFGGFAGGGGGTTNPITLLNNKDVKKELDLTDEQAAKVTPEVMAALAKVLSPEQYKRFKQIHTQQLGNNAFKEESIQTALGLNATQKKTIGELLETSSKELGEITRAAFGKGKGGGGGVSGTTEKLDKVRTEAREKIMSTLTKDQRKTWSGLLGEEFKMSTGFGGGFGNKGKTDPKNDK